MLAVAVVRLISNPDGTAGEPIFYLIGGAFRLSGGAAFCIGAKVGKVFKGRANPPQVSR